MSNFGGESWGGTALLYKYKNMNSANKNGYKTNKIIIQNRIKFLAVFINKKLIMYLFYINLLNCFCF